MLGFSPLPSTSPRWKATFMLTFMLTFRTRVERFSPVKPIAGRSRRRREGSRCARGGVRRSGTRNGRGVAEKGPAVRVAFAGVSVAASIQRRASCVYGDERSGRARVVAGDAGGGMRRCTGGAFVAGDVAECFASKRLNHVPRKKGRRGGEVSACFRTGPVLVSAPSDGFPMRLKHAVSRAPSRHLKNGSGFHSTNAHDPHERVFA